MCVYVYHRYAIDGLKTKRAVLSPQLRPDWDGAAGYGRRAWSSGHRWHIYGTRIHTYMCISTVHVYIHMCISMVHVYIHICAYLWYTYTYIYVHIYGSYPQGSFDKIWHTAGKGARRWTRHCAR